MRTSWKAWRSSSVSSSPNLEYTPQLLWGIVAAALIGYMMPWVSSPGVGLSLGAYDLAEWASLHPASQATCPIMLASLLLRIVPALLVIVVALNSRITSNSRINGVIGIMAVIGMSLLLLPPLEFFTEARNNPNYQQQFIISAGVLIAGFLATRRFIDRWRKTAMVSFCVASLGAGIFGLIRAYDLMQQYEIAIQPGLGGPLTLFFTLLAAFVALRSGVNPKQGRASIDALP